MDSAATGEKAWPELHRVRRAIVVVDVVESVRLMQAHEADFIDRWRRFVNEVRTQVLPQHGGRLVKSLGDGMLLEFEKVPEAVSASLAMHRAIERDNEHDPVLPAVGLRIGVHLADVVVDELDLYGAGVNLAARIAALAGPAQIVLSADARDAIVPSLDGELDDMGECYLKHVDVPVRCFQLKAPELRQHDLPLPAVDVMQGPSIAVMPFDAAAEEDAPGDAVAEELIGILSRSERLHVISRLSTRSLAGRRLPCEKVGEALGARYVLSGTVQRAGSGYRIHAELADASTSGVVWTESVRVPMNRLLDPDEGGAASIAAGVLDAMDRTEVQRARSLPLPTLRNYTLLVGGVTLMHRTGAHDFARAREILEFLAERTGRHPLPRAWLAKWHVLNVQQGWSASPAADALAALTLTRRALDVDPSCSLAHTVEGFARANILREFDVAEACYSRALDVNPNDSLAWLLSGVLRAFRDEGEVAVAWCERARQLSPLDPLRYFYDALSASAALTAGRYDMAVTLARRSLRLNRSHLSTHRALTAALALAGRGAEAHASAAELLARDPGFTVSGFLARTPGQNYGVARRIADALRDAGVPA